MIQSSSFISLMKVITAYRDKKAARLTKSIYLLPACNSSSLLETCWQSEIIATLVVFLIYMHTNVHYVGQKPRLKTFCTV